MCLNGTGVREEKVRMERNSRGGLGREKGAIHVCTSHLEIWPAYLSCLIGSVGRAFAYYTERYGLESYLRQLFFILWQLFFFSWGKEELSSGVVTLLCIVSMTDHSLMYIHVCACTLYMYNYALLAYSLLSR